MEVEEDSVEVITCLICCTSDREHFPSSNFLRFGRSQCAGDERATFDNFCRQLLSLQKVDVDLDLEGEESLSVCLSCLANINSALEANGRVGEVEARVRSLQWGLLREMRELQGHITALEERLGRIGESVKNSEGEWLEATSSGGDGRGARKRLGANANDSEDKKNDVFQFRQLILNVSEDLRRFRGELREKCYGPMKGAVIVSNTSEDDPMLDEEIEVKLELDDEGETNNDPLDTGGWDSECGISGELHDLAPNPDNASDDEGDSEAESEMEFIPNESDDESEDEPSSPGSNSGDEDGGNTDGEAEAEVDSDYEYDPVGEEKRISHPVRVRSSQIRRKRYDAKPITLDDLDIDLEGISNFRKFALRSLLNHHPRKPMVNSKEVNSAQYHLHNVKEDQKGIRFDFNPDTRSVHLMGVQVEMNEKDRTIKCSKCLYSLKVQLSRKKRSKEGLDHDAKRLMKTHILDEHYPEALKCPLCTDPDPQPCHSMKLYTAHLHTHLTRRSARICSICGKPFTNVSSLQYHLWSHKSEEDKAQAMAEGELPPKLALDPVFSCSTCDKEFPTKHRLEEHEESHMPKKARPRFSCPTCGVELLKKSLETHMKYFCNPVGDTSVKCSICEKVLKSKPYLWVHMRKHHSNKPPSAPRPTGRPKRERSHQCETCGKAFKTGKALATHVQHYHPKEQLQCPNCEKTFKNHKNLKSHMQRIHSELERLFQCEMCSKAYRFKVDLNLHNKRVHSEEKVYECGKGCGRSFPNEWLGKKHERSCNVEIKCSLCEKTFVSQHNVQNHMKRVHSQGEERPYQCEVCPKMFKVKEDLSRHLKIHSEENRYPCGKGCGKEFTMSLYCRRHEKICKGKPRGEKAVKQPKEEVD